jgi:hypothetical protein
MKKIFIITLAAFCVVAFGVGQAMAAGYDVTSSFGVRVTEQGPSEQIGSITINPQDPVAANPFTANQIITVELLGNATISATTVADYTFGVATPTMGNAGFGLDSDSSQADVDAAELADPIGVLEYRLVAVTGRDFFLIKVGPLAAAQTNQIIVGNDILSRICFNLVGTVYTADDPARQLVQVSYSDQLSNTYSGDTYVATVKPKSVVVENCDKTNPIDLCFTQQDVTCGVSGGTDTVCLEITDTATGAFPAANTYTFTIGKQEGGKAGVGFGVPVLNDEDEIPADAIAGTNITRYNRTGTEIEVGDYTATAWATAAELMYADTAYMTFEILFTANVSGPQTYTLVVPVYYDTCVATAGSWIVDLTAAKLPCGASFVQEDINVAQFVACGGVSTTAIFPYAAGSAGGWFNGLVITNPNSSSITVTFTITEADGDVYTGSATVAANQMAVNLAENVMNPTTTSSDAAFGDESYTITATAPASFYGFLFIGNGTMAQGYLPISVGGGPPS